MCLDLWTAVAIFLYFCEIDSMSVNINFCRFAVAGRSSGVRRTVPSCPPSISHLLHLPLASAHPRFSKRSCMRGKTKCSFTNMEEPEHSEHVYPN